MTHPPAPWQLTIIITITRKVQTKTEKECCTSSRFKPHLCSRISHEYSSLSFQYTPFYLNSPVQMVPPPTLGWEVDLQTKFLLLHSLAIENVYAIPVYKKRKERREAGRKKGKKEGRKQSQCLSADEWLNKIWYIHTVDVIWQWKGMNYCNMDKLWTHGAMWKKLDSIYMKYPEKLLYRDRK